MARDDDALRTLEHIVRHGESVADFAVATGAPLLLFAGVDGSVTLWRVTDRTWLARFALAPEPGDQPGAAAPGVTRVAAMTDDGRRWRVDADGRVVTLAWCPDEPMLVPVELEEQLRQVRDHQTDAAGCLAAARALAAPGALDGLDSQTRPRFAKAMADVITSSEDPAVREAMVVILAELDPGAATTACYQLFRWRDRGPDGTAGRLRARLTGERDPSIDELIACIPRVNSLIGVLTSEALAEHGAAAVPAIAAALRAFPPARDNSETWFHDETTKYRLLHALVSIGPAAAAAEATVRAVMSDPGIYRDTRWMAGKALDAMRGRG